MTPWMRKLHKWAGLLIGLQFVIWLASGLVMSLIDHDRVQGHEHQAQEQHIMAAWPEDALSPSTILSNASQPVHEITSHWVLHEPAYRLRGSESTWLVHARTAAPMPITGNIVAAIAQADYVGTGEQSQPLLLTKPTLEARGHAGPIWRVDFDDADATTIYVSGEDGRVLERRNDSWRLFDIVWMLHIMDYTGRQDFNSPWIIMLAAGGLWIALTGLWLLVASFRLSEFIPARWRPRRALSVFAPDGTRLRSIEARAGDSVYVALGRNGLQLPSNCGGGQSCGLCEVRVRGRAPPPTGADRQHLTDSKIKQGIRLACNLRVDVAADVEVPGGAELWVEREAIVEAVAAVTPFLREIILNPVTDGGVDFQPGAYLQVHVPPYEMTPDSIGRPAHHADAWDAIVLPDKFHSKEPLRRSYSLAMPTEKTSGRITLLARFSPGRQETKHPPGRGSSWLYSLKPGDKVHFSGPFGDFALKPGAAEKIFIGGGAGMAPLRAMIHSLLDEGATERIHYWYGARNLRDAPYVDEMADLAKQHSNFTWHLVLSDEAEHSDGLIKGLVHEATHEALLRDHPDIVNCEFYVCGPPAMLSATRQLLRQLGVPDERIAFDDFKI